MVLINEPYECEKGSALEELDCFHPLAFTLTLPALSQVWEEVYNRSLQM